MIAIASVHKGIPEMTVKHHLPAQPKKTAAAMAPLMISTRQTAASVTAGTGFLATTAQCLHLVIPLWIAAIMEPPQIWTKPMDATAIVPVTTLVTAALFHQCPAPLSSAATATGTPQTLIPQMAVNATATKVGLATTAVSLLRVWHSRIAVDTAPLTIWTRLPVMAKILLTIALAVTVTALVAGPELPARFRHLATLMLLMAATAMVPLMIKTRQTAVTVLALSTGLETTAGSTLVVSSLSHPGAVVWMARNSGCM